MAEANQTPRRQKRGYVISIDLATPRKTVISAYVEASTVREAMREAYKKLATWEGSEDTDITLLSGIVSEDFAIDRAIGNTPSRAEAKAAPKSEPVDANTEQPSEPEAPKANKKRRTSKKTSTDEPTPGEEPVEEPAATGKRKRKKISSIGEQLSFLL